MMTTDPTAVTNSLVQAAFEQIACPLEGHSLYETLEQAIRKAYELGAQKATHPLVPVPLLQFRQA